MRTRITKEGVNTLLLNLPLVWSVIWGKVTRPFKLMWAKLLIESKKAEAKWLHRVKGGTYYVVMVNWHDVRCMNKPQYEYCKKFIKKRFGKSLANQIIYRADGTLVKNPDFVGNL